MCGTTGYRTCGICANAGGCLCGSREDLFSPATKEQVEQRLKEGRYKVDHDVMIEYLDFLNNNKKHEDLIREIYN